MQQSAEMLADKLGCTSHVSVLLAKARKLGLTSAGDLCALAVARGCRHYGTGEEATEPAVSPSEFTNEELALALLNPSLEYSPQAIRCGAAMLGADGNQPESIAGLATKERAQSVVRYVAECGAKYEPQNAFWSGLLDLLPVAQVRRDDVLPHSSRFVAMAGYARDVGSTMIAEWQRPQRSNPQSITNTYGCSL